MKIYLTILILVSMTLAQKNGNYHNRSHHGPNCNHTSHINAGPGDSKVTIINVTDTTGNNGESKIYRELLDECYSDIPDIEAIEGDFKSTNEFAKGINQVNGEVLKNDWIQKYSASVEVHYMQLQTYLYIVSTKSIEGTPPAFEKVHKKRRFTKVFKSYSENGDSFAGRSRRFYFHSNKKSALKDAQRQAKTWLSQQEAVMCQVPIETTGK